MDNKIELCPLDFLDFVVENGRIVTKVKKECVDEFEDFMEHGKTEKDFGVE